MASGSVTSGKTPFHHGSHEGLLRHLADSEPVRGKIDAIVVPTIRPPSHLTEAAALARVLGCPLLTLHSGEATSALKARDFLSTDVDLMAVDIRPRDQLTLPSLSTCKLLGDGIFRRTSDLSIKRNLALVLAHELGWSRILYLDDDITDVTAGDVEKASGLLDEYNAVGFKIGGYPDNSVVCHAYREAGGEQDSFIGAGALAVDVNRCDSFFPDIYNDDWFYLLDGNARLQPTIMTGVVKQDDYDPFMNPERARSEELGDVLAEGLFWLLDQKRAITEADQAHWKTFLQRRRRFIESVVVMVQSSTTIKADKARVLTSLDAALSRLGHITPELCEGYLRAWATDRDKWRKYLAALPRIEQRSDAIDGLWRSMPASSSNGSDQRCCSIQG
jgi:hypothetical protein